MSKHKSRCALPSTNIAAVSADRAASPVDAQRAAAIPPLFFSPGNAKSFISIFESPGLHFLNPSPNRFHAHISRYMTDVLGLVREKQPKTKGEGA